MTQNTMRMAIRILLGVSAVCASSPAAPQSGATETSAPAPAHVRGYVHDVSRSRFRIGQNVSVEVDSPQLLRWRGSQGAWAIDPTNNWSMGVLDATTPTGPYILNETVHGARVKSYFIDAGLPADQIRDIRASFHGIGGGPANGTSVAPFQLESINSILTRSISGVPVIESVAWAKMTISGDVDMECVFWPPIDSAVVQRAVAFQRTVTDPDAKAAYLGKLPGPVYRDGGVVIHHTDPSIHAAPTAYVSYDVTLGPQGYSAMRHFDESGTEFRLPQELASPPRPPTELNAGLR